MGGRGGEGGSLILKLWPQTHPSNQCPGVEQSARAESLEGRVVHPLRRAVLRVVLRGRRLVVEPLRRRGGGGEAPVDTVVAELGPAAVLDELLDLHG